MLTADIAEKLISSIEGVTLIGGFSTNEEGTLSGKIEVKVGQEIDSLRWDVVISPYYPLKNMGLASIQFISTHLLAYPHIMENGSLCMHTKEYKDGENQFICDLEALKDWVQTYYIQGQKDAHYEHLVVKPHLVNHQQYSFCFADTREVMPIEDFGQVYYTRLQTGGYAGWEINNFVVQKFSSRKDYKKEYTCRISSIYLALDTNLGIYCLLKKTPDVYGKFIIEDYNQISELFSQWQKDYIYNFSRRLYKKDKWFFPLFCGYRIPCGEIHWQAMLISMDNLPIESICIGTGKERYWHTEFKPGKIQWVRTENISYEYFFGRGAMPRELAEKKMLVLGLGAIGSIVAETLTRCGAKVLSLYDIDQKESGNICRSTYSFYAGTTAKMYELRNALTRISPHVECTCLDHKHDLLLKSSDKEQIAEMLNGYDVVLDCTTDNQLMWILDGIESKAQIINLSITNHAQELVCAFSPHVSKTVELIYSLLNRCADSDWYNPTGCWSPTFKASYNDVASKVQFAVKHIIKMLAKDDPQSSFYITEDSSGLNITRL